MHRGERSGGSGSSPVLGRRCQVPLPCESSAERCPIPPAAPQSPRLPLSPACMRTQQCPSESSGAHSAENCSSSGSSGLSPGSDSDSSGVVCGGGGMRGVLSRYWSLESLHSATVITDGGLDKTALTDDVGSEEDLYEEFRSSNHRYGHPGGGGEQLAINEVLITDGGLDKTALTDDVGSEEDLYEEFRSSNHRYGHPGGGGEQLAINEPT
ncbi:uncharacterized protein LOC121363973 [Pyrgilauda ruficollis]|uniref:uncharacterized protein LOC121363973 n=1 Tax=Pyrgilauda ruficollis TaxID=221976 RepID=UPI001B865001|nr:uncharacterized protein LOC121363973 [Pyrgilauda ruficollis]